MEGNAPHPDFDVFGSEGSSPASSIFVYDKCPAQRAIIRKIINRVAARAIELINVHQRTSSPSCCIAVVGMGTEIDDEELRIIRELKTRGFRIIACGEGVESWSLKVRCLPLVAGAGQLLDKAATDFAPSLRRVLKQTLAIETKNQHEVQQIKSMMGAMSMVGESAAMMRVFRTVIGFSALSDLPVLITGETGTGKEGLARGLHRFDRKRCSGPFVPVNCGAIVPSLAESEFFGHRRGAFTGAERDRKGLIRSAQAGVLFLDEIGELDGVLQAKLLRVLEDSRVLGVGQDSDVTVNIRVVAATSRDLEKMSLQGRFRTDLFQRLNVLSIEVPALRERPDDLAPLIRHFLEKYQTLSAGVPIHVTADFLEALRQVELPGNVRQLENIVRQALARRENDDPLDLRDLPVGLLSNCRHQHHPLNLLLMLKTVNSIVPRSRTTSFDYWRLTNGTSLARWKPVSGMPWKLPCVASREINQRQPVSSASRHAACITKCTNIGWVPVRFRPESYKDFYEEAWIRGGVFYPAPANSLHTPAPASPP